jgi:hypothetical protein
MTPSKKPDFFNEEEDVVTEIKHHQGCRETRHEILLEKGQTFHLIVHFRQSYQRMKQHNKKLKKDNQKLHKELSLVQEKLRIYQARQGLDSLVQVIDEKNEWSPFAPHDGDQVNEESQMSISWKTLLLLTLVTWELMMKFLHGKQRILL